MDSDLIRNLPELLRDYLGPNKIITDTKISRLTAPGENFGSIMLRLDMTLLNTGNGTQEMLYAVAKILPETEAFRKLFNVQTTYTNEMAFYDIVVPSMQEFQNRLGITEIMNCTCRRIATRKNLGNDDRIDDDAVIVLENLMVSGFKNIERIDGFDLETTKLILRDLASFHGVFIAFKTKEPQAFNKNVKHYCHDFKVLKEGNVQWEQLIRTVLRENETTAPFSSKINYWGSVPRSTAREPFATVIHCDLWINNIMQKFENGVAVANKIVDFQLYNYGSAAADLFFFLWTSVSQPLLESKLDYFIKYYYENLIRVIGEHQCDMSLFTFEQFQREIELECDYEMGHTLLFVLFTLNGKNEWSEMERAPTTQELLAGLLPKTKERAWYMVNECKRRGWLK